MIRVDFHTHTFYSYDSVMKPAKILERAREKGITHLVVNDHNTIKGGLACKELSAEFGVEVIVGSEIKTDIGDVTGIFLKEEIPPGPYLQVLTQIKKQGGLSILNHPYVGHDLSGLRFELFDLIEGYNGRCNAEQNQKAIDLAKKYNKPFVSGSDAHTYPEVGNNYTTFETINDLLKPLEHAHKKAHNIHKVYSQLIKGIKRKDPILLTHVLLGAPKKIIFNK